MLHAQHIFANSLIFSRHLRVTGYNVLFHAHILCIALYWPTVQFYLCVYVLFVCWYVAPSGECYYNTLLCCDCFSSSSLVSCTFCALCMYSKFGHHSHHLGYLCAKFCFFRGLHCWVSPWRKITYLINHTVSYSFNQSISQLIWCPRNWSLCFGKTCKWVCRVYRLTQHIHPSVLHFPHPSPLHSFTLNSTLTSLVNLFPHRSLTIDISIGLTSSANGTVFCFYCLCRCYLMFLVR